MSEPHNSLFAVGTQSLHGNPYYLRAVWQVAQHFPLHLREAIYTLDGKRLAEKGDKYNQSVHMALQQQHLRRPVEDALPMPDPVDVMTLEAEAMTLCESSLLPRMMMQAVGSAQHWRLLAPLSEMVWPYVASFKLSVMRHTRHSLYVHSLTTMLVATFLGICEELDDETLALLAPAALLHDTGMLYVDPSWDDPQRSLSVEERRQLTTHSVLAMQVVRESMRFPREVERAVLEHHERMDGSGYPRGLRGGEISQLGQILMVAEVVAAFFEKYAHDMPVTRLSLMLRLNHHRYPRKLVEHVHKLLTFGPKVRPDDIQPIAGDVRRTLVMLSMLIDYWTQLRTQLPPRWQLQHSGRACMFLEMRIASLVSSLAEAGALPRQQMQMLHSLRNDPDGLIEQSMINREALWQLEACMHTCLRRWPKVLDRKDDAALAVKQWIDRAQMLMRTQSRYVERPAFFA